MTLANVPVDLHKWLQAMEKNPLKSVLVPTQISSVLELKERTFTVLKAVREAKKRLEHAKEQISVVEKTCDDDIAKEIESAHERNQLIKARLGQVFGKFERILTDQGRANVDKRPQEDLISHQKALLRKLCEHQKGLLRQIEQAKQ